MEGTSELNALLNAERDYLTVYTRNGYTRVPRSTELIPGTLNEFYPVLNPLIDSTEIPEGSYTPYGPIRNKKPEQFYLHPEIQPYAIANRRGRIYPEDSFASQPGFVDPVDDEDREIIRQVFYANNPSGTEDEKYRKFRELLQRHGSIASEMNLSSYGLERHSTIRKRFPLALAPPIYIEEPMLRNPGGKGRAIVGGFRHNDQMRQTMGNRYLYPLANYASEHRPLQDYFGLDEKTLMNAINLKEF